MPLEFPILPLEERVADLNQTYKDTAPEVILEQVMSDPIMGQIALSSSFGAGSVALLHMVAQIDRTLPVLFLDTEMLFAETLSYQSEVADLLRLADVRTIRPDRAILFEKDTDALLHRSDPDACCDLRKVAPLETALSGFDSWINGRRGTGNRENLDVFEADSAGRIKVNPLARWSGNQVSDYIDAAKLPRHPLVASGFQSLGCRTCTTRVAPGEDERAGRWRGREKVECGIHFDANGQLVRGLAA